MSEVICLGVKPLDCETFSKTSQQQNGQSKLIKVKSAPSSHVVNLYENETYKVTQSINGHKLTHGGSNGISLNKDQSSVVNGSVETYHLDVKNVTYSVRERQGRWWQGLCLRKSQDKVILNGINLRIHSGEVTAILGNSGSGKTTILDVTGSRAETGRVTGDVDYCGQTLSASVFRRRAGYVLQSDNHMANLTVEETLTYVAQLKFIDNSERHMDVNARVDLAIYQMGMRHLRDSIVGGVIKRGLSGGEKRRLSIALQLIQDPAIVLLDEPTTGLDSFTAHSIVQTLSQLAKKYNKIVLLSIHQPRSDIFNLFDRIGILSQGEMVYYGPKSELVTYFTKVGYPCPTYANPLDHYVDVSSIDRRNEQDEQETSKRSSLLKKLYLKSNTYLNMMSDMETKGHQDMSVTVDSTGCATCTYFKQTGILLRRLNVNIWRSKISMFGRITQPVFFGLILFTFVTRLTDDLTGIQDRTGLFFETTSAVPIMGLLNALAMFPAVRDLYYRERADGLYKGAPFLTAYFIHIFPFHLISSFIYAVLIYWGTGCYPDVGRFFIFFSVVLMMQYLGELISVVFLCICDSVALAQSTNMLFFTVNVTVASGLLRASSGLLLPLQWLQYLSFNKYASEIVMANEYHNLTFLCDNAPDNVCSFTGDDYLDEFFPDSVENMTRNFMILTGFIVGMWITNVAAYRIKGNRHLN